MEPVTETRAPEGRQVVDRRDARSRVTVAGRPLPSVPTLVVLLALVTYGAYLLWLDRDAFFWGDDWHFLFRRGSVDGASQGDLLTPFNGHWSTLMVLLYRALFETVGLTTYLPYVGVLIAFHLGIVLAIDRLLVRTGAGTWVSAGVALAILFTGVAPEMVIFDAAMNHSGSILFGLLALLTLIRRGADRRAVQVSWLLLVLSLMWSGTGISAVVMAGVLASACWGFRRAGAIIAVPTAVFLAWFIGWGRHGTGTDLTWSITADVPAYVWAGLTKVFGTAVSVPEVGPVVFGMLLLNLVTDHRPVPMLRNLAWAGLAAATVQLIIEAITRSHMGVESASSGRYGYFTLVLLSPALALAASRLFHLTIEPRWLPALAVSIALVGYGLHGVNAVRQYAQGYTGVSGEWRQLFLGMIESADAGQRQITDTFDGGVNAGLTQDLIASEQVRRALPDGETSLQARMKAETMFNLGVGTQTYDLFNPAFVDLTYGWNRKIKKLPGCASYTATVGDPMLQVATVDGIEIGVKGPASEVITRLRRDDYIADGRIWKVEPGKALHVASTAKDAVIQVSFNAPGEYIICKQ